MSPEAVVAAVEGDLGMICYQPDPSRSISCDEEADPGRSRAYGDVWISVIDQDDGSYKVSNLSVAASEIDRGMVEDFVGRFGFSPEDLDSVINRGERITRGEFTMNKFKSQSILIGEAL